MLITKALICPWAIIALQVAGLVITLDAGQLALLPSPTPPSTVPTIDQDPHDVYLSTPDSVVSVTAPVPDITQAPSLTSAVLQRRQPCCFDDRGFRVDCATWTGYYYTWGPAGNPYEGGPQCDGNWNGGNNGQNDGNGQVAPYNNSAAKGLKGYLSMAIGAGLLVLAAMV